jgi:Fur family iron response transcriptional regulator
MIKNTLNNLSYNRTDYSHIHLKLKKVGLRPTKQRTFVASLLLNGINRHFTAEDLQAEVSQSGITMAIGTIYNCLNHFVKRGLIKNVETNCDMTIFDTNVENHYHFLDEETGKLTDIMLLI